MKKPIHLGSEHNAYSKTVLQTMWFRLKRTVLTSLVSYALMFFYYFPRPRILYFLCMYFHFLSLSLTPSHTHTKRISSSSSYTHLLSKTSPYSLPVRSASRKWVRQRSEVEQRQKTLTYWKENQTLSVRRALRLMLSLSYCPPSLSFLPHCSCA